VHDLNIISHRQRSDKALKLIHALLRTCEWLADVACLSQGFNRDAVHPYNQYTNTTKQEQPDCRPYLSVPK
jgi:hypothetical protein